MSLMDKIISGLDTTIKVGIKYGVPAVKKTISAVETAGYHAAKHNLENHPNYRAGEKRERAERVIARYEAKQNNKED